MPSQLRDEVIINAFVHEEWTVPAHKADLLNITVRSVNEVRDTLLRHLTHYNQRRPHQSLDNRPLDGHAFDPSGDSSPEQLECAETLGRVLKSYSWKAAE